MGDETKHTSRDRSMASGWLALNEIAASRGDGLIPGFSDLLARAGGNGATPRLIVSNDDRSRNHGRRAKDQRTQPKLSIVHDAASQRKLG